MERRVNLVFGGGGMKAIAYCGVLKELERRDIKIEAFAGVSAGTLIGITLAAGYNISEIEELIYKTDFSKFAGNMTKAISGYVAKISGGGFLNRQLELAKEHAAFEIVRRKFGIEDGRATREWIVNVLREKNLPANIKFKDLERDFRIFVYDMTDDCGRVFSKKETPEAYVVEAILGSMALIPIFQPVEWLAPDDTVHLLVDGGFIDVCPMEIFANDPENKIVTIGLLSARIESGNNKKHQPITNLLEMLFVLIDLTMKNQEYRHRTEESWNRIINIQTESNLMNFIIDGGNITQKRELIECGRAAAVEFLNRWGDVPFMPLPWPLKQIAEKLVPLKKNSKKD